MHSDHLWTFPLFELCIHRKDSWSVTTMTGKARVKSKNLSKDHVMANASRSLVSHFCSSIVSFLEPNSSNTGSPSCIWSKAHPMPRLLASHTFISCPSPLGEHKSTLSQSSSFRCSKISP